MRRYPAANPTKRIEIIGSLGTGKTTLVQALANYNFLPVHDPFDQNPHLTDFYKDPSTHAYDKDHWFLEAQHKQVKEINAQPIPAIMDYSLTTSQAFIDAGPNTKENKQKLQSEWQKVRTETGYPDIVLVMPISRAEQRKRIATRGREGEDQIPDAYLDLLDASIYGRVAQLPPVTKVITLDEGIDFTKESAVKALAERLHKTLGKGKYIG
jgi:deoxyadenosine/deoxycytidine kinase